MVLSKGLKNHAAVGISWLRVFHRIVEGRCNIGETHGAINDRSLLESGTGNEKERADISRLGLCRRYLTCVDATDVSPDGAP